MMEETEMRTTPNLSCMDRRTSELTYEPFQKLRKHFETDSNPMGKTLQALAEERKLPKGVIKYWFSEQRHNEMRCKRFSKGHKSWRTCCTHCPSRGTTRQKNSKESSQNDPGLPEGLEALKRLRLSSGYQSRDGMPQDF